jgi:hypothetical protein
VGEDECLDGVGVEGSAEEEALDFVDVLVAKLVELFDRLDAFGEGVQAEVAADLPGTHVIDNPAPQHDPRPPTPDNLPARVRVGADQPPVQRRRNGPLSRKLSTRADAPSQRPAARTPARR